MKNQRFGFISLKCGDSNTGPKPGQTRPPLKNKGFCVLKWEFRIDEKMPLLPEALPPRTGGTGRAQPLTKGWERIHSSYSVLTEERDKQILLGSRGLIRLLTNICSTLSRPVKNSFNIGTHNWQRNPRAGYNK
jgi:hypothetical protein